MRMKGARLLKPAMLTAGTAILPAAWAHPGHEHSAGWLAQLLHSVTNWGPLLVVLVIAVAGSYWLWKSRDS